MIFDTNDPLQSRQMKQFCHRHGHIFHAESAASHFQQPKPPQQYADTLVVGKINIDEEAALSQQEQIEVIPTLVLYRDGQAVASIVAPESKAMIDQFLEESLKK